MFFYTFIKWNRSNDTDLRFTRHESKTALASFIDLLGNQRPASQTNPHGNGLFVVLGHSR